MIRLLYIILLGAAALFYPLYEDKLSYITLVTLCILPVISFLQLHISGKFLKCSCFTGSEGSGGSTIYKGSEEELCIRLSNNSVFPLSGCALRVKAVFRPTGEIRYYDAAVPLPALRTETVSVNIEGVHCGAAEISLEYIRIFDQLRLFSAKRFENVYCGKVYIIPDINENYFGEGEEMLKLPDAGTDKETEKRLSGGGGAPGDVAGYREFAPGDKLSAIHYKLSARFDKDIVKDMPPQSSRRYLLTADMSESDPDIRDNILERLMSCAYYLHFHNAEVYAAVPEGTECEKLFLDPAGHSAAAVYDGERDHIRIACALAESDHSGTLSESGFIICRIKANMTENTAEQSL